MSAPKVRILGRCRCGGAAVEEMNVATVTGESNGRPYSYRALHRDGQAPTTVIILHCPRCGGSVRNWREVQGAKSSTPCTASCRHAKDWQCSCSCAGANHGLGHLAPVTA